MWKRAVFALFAVAAGTNVPTPLLLVYRDTLDLGPDVLTAVFGCYALGLVPALALAGPLSDRLGRRRVMLPAMVLAALTSLLLHLRPGVREHFLGWLRPRDPALADDYERRYRRAYLPDAEQRALSARVRALAERAGARYTTPADARVPT